MIHDWNTYIDIQRLMNNEAKIDVGGYCELHSPNEAGQLVPHTMANATMFDLNPVHRSERRECDS